MANVFLECLYHGVEHVYDAPIIGPTGKVRTCTHVHVCMCMYDIALLTVCILQQLRESRFVDVISFLGLWQVKVRSTVLTT